jgi:pyruvate kinase
MHAAVQLADALGSAALLIPTSTGGGARACSKYRPARPIIALIHDVEVGRQLSLEWGVTPVMLPVAETVDELVDASLQAGRGLGLPSGAGVILTAGRRTGTPGATSLIMVREIP